MLLNYTQSLVQGVLYNSLGRATNLNLGNGLRTTVQYWGVDHLGVPSTELFGLLYQILAGSAQNMTFGSYDLTGNPTGVSYADHTAESLTYGYNELNQLVSVAGVAGSPAMSYNQPTGGLVYNIGNLMSYGSLNPYSYPTPGSARPHAPTSVSGLGSYQYDANGNRSSDPSGHSYSYDGENRLLSTSAGITNTFDGDGKRLIRVANGVTMYSIGEWYEFNPSTQQATVYYPFLGQPLAMRNGADGNIYYLHHDHLGSLSQITTSSDGDQWAGRYWPFGGLRWSSGTLVSDRLFTGQTRDLGNDSFDFF
jgi:hypothetical protein